jgi:PadR family transcriptional regulator, regulatory protein PadR
MNPDRMARKPAPTSRIELLQGTLDFIILQTLRWGPCHGYGIVGLIRAQSNSALQVETGSLYPALQRLMRESAISAEWGTSQTERRVRMYRLTTKGRKRLVAERSRWEQLSEAIAGLMQRPPEPSDA